LGLSAFNEDDRYDALDDLRTRQEKIETKLWCHYLTRYGTHPALFLDDVASSYLDGEKNALGLLADSAGEPLAVRVFVGNTSDPSTVATQIEILTRHFSITEVIFVGDCGMIKKVGKQKLDQSAFRQNTALTDPQIRLLLSKKTLQLELFSEEAGEAEADGVRDILRKNPDEAKRIRAIGSTQARSGFTRTASVGEAAQDGRANYTTLPGWTAHRRNVPCTGRA